MKVAQVVEWLNVLAPYDTAESFDNVGLLMGDMNAEVTKALFAMDVTQGVVEEAVRIGAELIIAHHPFIFRAIKRISYTGPQGRALCTAAQHQLNIIGAHTNWDKAPGGVGDSLAAALGLSDVMAADDYVRVGTLPSPLSPAGFSELIEKQLRIVPRFFGENEGAIRRVAVAGGAYGEGYEAAIAAGADAYIVGEIAHHEILDACARGLRIYDAGHFATEFPGVRALYNRFLTDALSAEAYLYKLSPYPGAILA